MKNLRIEPMEKSFQDQPCDPGAKGEAMILSDPSPPYEGPPPSQKKGAAAPAKRGKLPPQPEIKGDELSKQRIRELEARNRTLACNAARRDLYALKTPRPVYRTGKNGEREFVEDANRDSEIQAAQQRVAESCK